MVIPPGKFVEVAAELAKGENIAWVSTDAECIISEEAWRAREVRGERVECVSSVRAPIIGRMGLAGFPEGRFTDAPAPHPTYVRPPGAENFSNGSPPPVP